MEVIKELQEMQKLGILRDYNIVEKAYNYDFSEFEDMRISDAADLFINLCGMAHN